MHALFRQQHWIYGVTVTVLNYGSILGRFFSRSCFWFKSYKFFSNFVIGSLRKYSKNCQSSLIYKDISQQGIPRCTATPLCYVLQLNNCHSYNAIFSSKAVIFHWEVKLVRSWFIFITQNAARMKKMNLEQGDEFHSSEEWACPVNIVDIKMLVVVSFL